MTLRDFARRCCANFQPDGSCLGAMIEDDGAIRRCCPKPTCVLGTPGQRCIYFEECVAPNAKWYPSVADALNAYRIGQLPTKSQASARCKCGPPKTRSCPCGTVLAPRQRYCPACKRARRRASWHQQRQKG